ncbi:hypothetical protein PoB_005563700 [Plakobranchus ocellatus]|uniref:Uncharacterized protein n=1 Tax=Plakobranchus ocellatus TaxID=259542 RepID=A0AAV4CD61_9GAST|nr:hypothetical protein PoB_005563700 [Plakobranchus ocellatus]
MKEVSLDMHDDPKLNRIYVTESHTLVIRETRLKHQGTYFCRDISDVEENIKRKLSEEDFARFIKVCGQFITDRFSPGLSTIKVSGRLIRQHQVLQDSQAVHYRFRKAYQIRS